MEIMYRIKNLSLALLRSKLACLAVLATATAGLAHGEETRRGEQKPANKEDFKSAVTEGHGLDKAAAWKDILGEFNERNVFIGSGLIRSSASLERYLKSIPADGRVVWLTGDDSGDVLTSWMRANKLEEHSMFKTKEGGVGYISRRCRASTTELSLAVIDCFIDIMHFASEIKSQSIGETSMILSQGQFSGYHIKHLELMTKSDHLRWSKNLGKITRMSDGKSIRYVKQTSMFAGKIGGRHLEVSEADFTLTEFLSDLIEKGHVMVAVEKGPELFNVIVVLLPRH